MDTPGMGVGTADVCVVGFGFAGLATLANLVADGRRGLHVTVVAPDARGLGVAYGTTDPEHRLNVRAERMGAWADRQDDFSRWLESPAGAAACADLGVPVPDRKAFAPRVVFARYLTALREQALRTAAERGVSVTFVAGEATDLRRTAGGWRVRAGRREVEARCCVLAVGHEARGTLTGPGTCRGPWALRERAASWGSGPAVVAGTGLTGVDAVLSLRGAGFGDEVVMVSRHGLLPRPHCEQHRPYAFTADRLDRITCAADVRDLVCETIDAGRDWRLALEGLRPHTQRVWRQFSDEAQREVVQRWSAVWGAHRHRMAPDVARRLQAERDAGTLRVVAGRVATAGTGVELRRSDGATETLEPAVVVDCTGANLDWTRSTRPVLRGLVERGDVTPHHTGLGVTATEDHAIAPGLHAVGSALTGQLWESIAVPELREQAATVAAAVGAATALEPVAVAA